MSPEANPIPSDSRILLVDDNMDATFILSMALRLKGYQVQCGASGPEALSIAEVWHPQAILLDISMPGMDGYETCRLLRQQAGGQAIAIIAITGYGQADDYERSQVAGFDEHLVKPVNLTSLPLLLAELIQKKQTNAKRE